MASDDLPDWMGGSSTTTAEEPNKPDTPKQPSPEQDLPSWLQGDGADRLNASLKASGNIPPDHAAKVLRVKDQTGLPSNIVSRNLTDLESKQNSSLATASDIQKQAPKVADWLAEDPHHASVAGPDIPILSFLERQFSYQGNQLERGFFDMERSALGFKSLIGMGSPEDDSRLKSLNARLETDLNKPAPGKISNVFGKFTEAAPMLGGFVGLGAAAATAGLPTAIGTAAGAVAMGVSAAGDAYLDFKNRKDAEGNPLSDTEARGYATGVGVLNGALGMIKAEKLLENVPGLRMLTKEGIGDLLTNPTTRQAISGYFKRIGETSVVMGGYNGMSSLIHSVAGKLAEMQNDKSLMTASPVEIISTVFSPDILKEAAQSVASGLTTGALFSGSVGGLKFFNDYRSAIRTQESWRNIGEAVKSAQMSKTAPEQIEKVISRIAPDQNVFIPMDKWQTYWESKKIDPKTAFREAVGNTNAYDESMRAGTDLQIPAAKYATTIAPSEHSEAFLSSLRSHPDALNAEEAEQGNKMMVEQEKVNKANRKPSLIQKGINLVKDIFGKEEPAKEIQPKPITSKEFIDKLPPEHQAAIEKARQGLIGEQTTEEKFSDNKGNYTPERQKIHEEIAKSFDKPEAVAPEGTKPVAKIVIGPPASGKSTAIQNMPGNFVEIDNDIVKSKLPEFDPNKAALFQNESSHIEKMILSNTVSKKMNFVYSAVGRTSEKFVSLVKELKSAGYDVDLVHMKITPEQAAMSALKRHMEGGRYVDPDYIINDVGLKTEETYDKLKSEVRNYEQYESNPTEGQKPQLRERSSESGGLPGGPDVGRGEAGSIQAPTEAAKQTSVSLPSKEESRLKFTKDSVEKSLLAARMEQGTTPLFDDPKAVGMKPEQEARYLKARLEAEQSASSQMANKIRGEQDRIKNADRKSLRDEIEPKVNAQKEYVALDILRGKKDVAEKLGLEPFKLDKASIDKDYPDPIFKNLPKGITGENGLHPDQAAEILGYKSGGELLFNLAGSPDREQVINDQIDERLQEKYGNPLDQEHLRNEAFKSIHNEDRGRLLQLELQHLASNDFAAFKGMVRAITRDVPRLQEVKDQARDMIGTKLAGETQPYLYQRAESLAGREARELFLKGDIQKAFEAKTRELLNHELFKSAQDAREQMDKDLSFASRFDRDTVRAKLGKAGADYLEQIDAMREKFDMAPVSGKEIGRRQSLRDFVERQRQAGYEPAISPEIMNDAYRKSYREMSNDELHGIVDAMRNIDHLAGLKTKLLKIQADRTYDEVKTGVVESLQKTFDIQPEDLEKPINLHPSMMEKMGKGLSDFAAWRTKMEFLFRFLDGGKYHGPAWETFFNPMNEAENFKTDKMREAYNSINDIFSVYSKAERAGFHHDLTYIPEIKMNMNKMDMLMTVLHWGNEGNRAELMRGYKWTEDQVRSIWKNLQPRDFETANKIWKYIDSYWPEISKQEREMNGLVPKKIDASPFDVAVKDGPSVHLDGGYFPLVYDKNISWRAAALGEGDSIKDLFATQAGRAATKHGWTNERIGGGGMAPSLNMTTLVNHVSDVIHDLAYREPVTDVYKLINDSDIKDHIEASAGKELYKQLNPWLKRIAGDRPWNPLGPLEALNTVRSNMTAAELGLKFTSAAIHSTSFLTAARELGPKYSFLGLKDSANILSAWNFVKDRSEFMRSRPDNFDRDIRAAGKDLNIAGVSDSLLAKLKAYSPIQRSSFWAIMRAFDLGVAIPTWQGAYRKAMEGGVINIDAGNEREAIDYADQLVRDTKGSGAAKDLAPIQTAGGQLGKLFTMFYTQLNVIDNQFMEAHREFKLDKNIPKLMSTAAMVWFLQAPMVELIRGRTPQDDESWGKWLAKSELLYPMSMIPGLREAVGYWERGDLEASPVFESMKSMLKTSKDLAQITPGLKSLVGEKDEWTEKDYQDALMSIGYASGLPTRQAIRTTQYLYDWMTGAEQPDNPMEGIYRSLVGRKAQPKQ